MAERSKSSSHRVQAKLLSEGSRNTCWCFVFLKIELLKLYTMVEVKLLGMRLERCKKMANALFRFPVYEIFPFLPASSYCRASQSILSVDQFNDRFAHFCVI